ncbi:MAG TPA: class B sortase, partial [Clostridiales bacterium]|nr:class B sortase [Clostridiales bacterium]
RAGVETLSTNSVIYGHKTETGLQVFNDLDKYLDYDFYVNNPIIEYGTLYKDYKWKIFAVYISAVESKDDNGYFFYYINPNIKAGKFPGFIDQIKQYSRFFTAIDLNEKDKILQLSTCIYENDMPGKPVNSRLVVAAKLMAEGESEDVDPSLVLDRKDFRRPQVWYDRYGKKNPYAGQPNWKQ